MKISNARVYRNGRFERSSVEFSDKISAFDVEGGVDAHGAYLVPGFIDIHTHGAIGYDASDCRADEIPALAGYYAAHGVTSFCFTTMTIGEDALAQAMCNIRGYERQGAQAKCTGVHLEGPFVSYKKRGAQKAENIRMPDLDLFYRMSELSGGKLKIITMAPELDGAVEFIRAASKVCAVSLGHTTADYATAMAGFEAGATQATHLFNAMQPLHHREPGLIGAALMAGAEVELICDGLHIHPAVINAVYRMFGKKMIIISDSLRCAGLCDGNYDLAGQPIVVKNGRATLLDGTLAGSSSNLLQELKNVVSYGIPLEDAVYAMTVAPAKAINSFGEIGSLEVGKCADMLLLDEELNLKATFIDGELINGSL